METNNSVERRIAVKIRYSKAGNDTAIAHVHYFKNDMKIDFYQRWKWYFDYRAAILRVKDPKGYIDYYTAPYDYVLPEDIYAKKLSNLIIAAKSKKTQYSRQIQKVKANWNQLFPIEDDPQWTKVMNKLNYYESRLQDLMNEQSKVIG